MSDAVCFYVDNSNIFISGKRIALMKGEPAHDFRIYFRNFIRLAVDGREVSEVVWGGSIPPPEDTVWTFLEDELRIKPDLIPRSSTGENNTVDHLIQLRMHRHARKYKDDPGIMVLATGDGAGYANEEGFLFDIESFLADGWRVEVLSWGQSCNAKLKSFAEDNGRFVLLDQYYDQITFIKNVRVVSPL